MKHDEALKIAQDVVEQLRPHCERIEIAGSIRRVKPEVKDIEVCVIPKTIELTSGLFGDEKYKETSREFIDTVNQWYKIKGEPFGKYTQRRLIEGINLDLFMATEENWGCIYLIRTGSWEFSKQFMVWLLQKGLKCDGGYVWQGDKIIPTPTEERMFTLVGRSYIEPQNRNL